MFVYSVLLSLPEQPPCLCLGLCRDSVAAAAADLLSRPLDVLTPVNREREGGGGASNYFHSDFAGITFLAAVASECVALSQSEEQAGTAVAAHRTILVRCKTKLRDG